MPIDPPPIISETFAFLALGDSVIPSAPQIHHWAKAYPIESQTSFNLVPFVDPSSDSMGLGLSPDVDAIVDENSSVVASRSKLLQPAILATVANLAGAVWDRLSDWFCHLLATHVLVITCEVDHTAVTWTKDWVIITRRDMVDGISNVDR